MLLSGDEPKGAQKKPCQKLPLWDAMDVSKQLPKESPLHRSQSCLQGTPRTSSHLTRMTTNVSAAISAG